MLKIISREINDLTHLTQDVISPPNARVRARIQKLRALESDVSDPGLLAHQNLPVNAPSLTVLALDLGTTTGWAVRPREEQIAHGTINFKPQRFEGGGMRYLRFKHWLSELKSVTGDLHAVYFEEVRRHVGVDAAHAYGGFMAHLTAWCEHHNIPYQGVPVGTIKRHATGKGNASKDEMIAAVRARGFDPMDDNEADALALLLWVIETQEI